MKHEKEGYTRKMKYKNKDYDEGERRRGKEKIVKEKKEKLVKKDHPKKETVSIKKPESIRPAAKIVFKPPVKRSAEELSLIKTEFSRRFKESLHAKADSNEDVD